MTYIAVISSGRPARVAEMKKHLGNLAERAVWYVGADEGADYRYAGADLTVEAGTLSHARNLALEEAFRQDEVCAQLSDDLTGVDWSGNHDSKHRITLERAIGMIVKQLASDVKLAGAGATDNVFFMPVADVSEHVFIIGDLMAIAPNPLRFDENLNLKEDLEYSIQHLKEYGQVARLNTILANWQHRTNHGGAVQYRTAAGEKSAVDYIMTKHPGWVVENGRRDNELLLRWPPITIPDVSPLRGQEVIG